MLKQKVGIIPFLNIKPAAFRRLCVETATQKPTKQIQGCQPPSGGCVLKPLPDFLFFSFSSPAAFRRLCVETSTCQKFGSGKKPAAFRRLCVETPIRNPTLKQKNQPPSGGCVLKHACKYAQDKYACPAAFRRLCVETILGFNISSVRFPAAFRRLCVETIFLVWIKGHAVSSRLQAAVC